MEIKAKTLVFEARRFLPYQVIATVHIFKPSWRPSNSSLTNYGFTLYDILQCDHSFKVCDYLSFLLLFVGFFFLFRDSYHDRCKDRESNIRIL